MSVISYGGDICHLLLNFIIPSCVASSQVNIGLHEPDIMFQSTGTDLSWKFVASFAVSCIGIRALLYGFMFDEENPFLLSKFLIFGWTVLHTLTFALLSSIADSKVLFAITFTLKSFLRRD